MAAVRALGYPEGRHDPRALDADLGARSFRRLRLAFSPLAVSAPPSAPGQGGVPSASSERATVPAALPAIALHPKSAASLAESKRLAAEADRTPDDAERVPLLRRAIAVEPANRDAQMALAAAVSEDHPDEALAILTALHKALRDSACRECLEDLAGSAWQAAEGTEDQAVREKLRQLASSVHGPPTRVTAAAEAVWKAFTAGEWRQLAPYVGPRTRVHVEETLADPPGDWTRRLSPRALRSWFERRYGYDLHRGDNWFCDARCCEYSSADPSRGDVWSTLMRVCFVMTGAHPTLTRLDWEDG